jgi:hypothetical protein
VIDNSFGIPVALHDRCPNCGSSVALVDRGGAPTYRRLSCDGCGCSRGRVGKDLRVFLEKFVGQFGWHRPIILRTGKVFKPEQPAVAAETQLKRKRKVKRKMKMSELFPSKYLRAADLQGKSRIVTIDHVEHEEFKDDGAVVKKTVIYFKRNGTNTQPMVCNKTNWKMIVAITGAEDDEDWAGARLELRSEKVNSPGGRIVDSIRVHEAPKPKKALKEELNDEVGF